MRKRVRQTEDVDDCCLFGVVYTKGKPLLTTRNKRTMDFFVPQSERGGEGP